MKFLKRTLPLGLFGLALLGGSALAAAPESIVSKGIGLTPAIQNITLNDNPQTSFKIQIDNRTGSPITLSASSLDFKSLNETGGIAFIGSGSGPQDHKYGLADWLDVPGEPFQIKPHASQQVTIGVNNRSDLSPGGHYAAVLFKNSGTANRGTNKVDVNQEVATLVFVKKTGGEIYDLSLQKPSFRYGWLQLPSNLDLLINNTGNTQTAPRGILTITGPFNKTVSRGIINPDSGLVLPGSTRLYKTPLFMTTRAWLPGHYTATVTYRPADIPTAKINQYTFTYLALPTLILAAILVLGAAVLAIYVRKYFKK